MEEDVKTVPNFENIQESNHNAWGVSAGGKFLLSGDKTSANKGTNASKGEGEAAGFVGLSGGVNNNKDELEYAIRDINADGLPDKVFSDGSVRLNLGYKFDDKTKDWGYRAVNEGESYTTNPGLSPSLNIANFSFALGLR